MMNKRNEYMHAPLMRLVRRGFALIISVLASSSALAQENGMQNYQLYCSACHGADGVGAKENPNPPLAKSEWLIGEPDRAISAVLHGLKGPVEVRGKLYNLAMPPQGAVLNDEQLASILSYVRTSFGNEESEVTTEQVRKVRADLKDRKEYFTAAELLKQHPIPYPSTFMEIKELIYHVYEGKWEDMPNFSQLEAVLVDDEQRGLIDVAHAGDRNKEFAIVWSGKIVAKSEKIYTFRLDASDGARLYIDGQLVTEVEGVGPRGTERARAGRIRMVKDKAYDFKIEYFNNQGNPGISLNIGSFEEAHHNWLSESRLLVNSSAPSMPVVPSKGSAAIFRKPVKGSPPRAVSVGYDGGVNLTFAPSYLGPATIWEGDFVDAGPHWTLRGTARVNPAGKNIVNLLNKPAFALLTKANAKWPRRPKLPLDYKSYSLDKKGLPTFHYTVGDVSVSERYSFDDSHSQRCLKRELVFKGDIPKNLKMALSQIRNVKSVGKSFLIDKKVKLSVLGLGTKIHTSGKSTLYVPVEEGKLTLLYTWKSPKD